MPENRPGLREVVTATKATTHGAPAVEVGLAGIAHKSQQIAAMAPSLANAALAVQIGVGEEFVIRLDGTAEVDTSLLPAGAAAGDPLYIKAADNTLHLAADALAAGVLNAGFVKFGVLVEKDTSSVARSSVNLNQRSSF